MNDTELTRQLAERVMGWSVWGPSLKNAPAEGNAIYLDHRGTYWRRKTDGVWPWRPLECLDDAMVAVERLKEQKWEYALGSCPEGHYAHFSNYERQGDLRWPVFHTVAADRLERAICLAALRVMGGQP